MTTPTSNAAPSNDVSDLLFNAEKLDEAINSTADTYTDRLGVTHLTMVGAMRKLGYEVPVAFTSGLNIARASQTVVTGGQTYHANPASVPFTTTGTFDAGQWLLLPSNISTFMAGVMALTTASAVRAALGAQVAGSYQPAGNYLSSAVNAWNKDAAGDDRLYFNSNGQTIIRGFHPSYPASLVAENGLGLVVRSTGGVSGDVDAVNPSDFPRLLQVQTIAANAAKLQLIGSVALSGAAVDFGSLPAGLRRITIITSGMSTNGGSNIVARIGNGSILTTGYQGSSLSQTGAGLGGELLNSGFMLSAGHAAGSILEGSHALIAHTSTGKWSWSGQCAHSDGVRATDCTGSLSIGAIDTLRITTVGGDTFDAGTVTVYGEF